MVQPFSSRLRRQSNFHKTRAASHFIEFFTWHPSANRTWALMWRLFEVVRTDLLQVAAEEVVMMPGEQPPVDSSFDRREWIRLSVNDNGQAEWAILRGPHQNSGVIESDTERKARNKLELARAAAEAKVEWGRVRDAKRAPVLAYSDADGCGHVFVHGWSVDRDEAVTISADKELLGLSTTAQTFDIASRPGIVDLKVHVFSRAVRSWPLCTDVSTNWDPVPEVWEAIAGTVTIQLSQPVATPSGQSVYRATIQIIGAEFVSPSGTRIKQVRPIVLTALAGLVSG